MAVCDFDFEEFAPGLFLFGSESYHPLKNVFCLAAVPTALRISGVIRKWEFETDGDTYQPRNLHRLWRMRGRVSAGID
jgi:hypothetical protein